MFKAQLQHAFLIHICNRDPALFFFFCWQQWVCRDAWLRLQRSAPHLASLSLRRALQLCRFVVSQEAAHVCVKQCLLCHVCVAEVPRGSLPVSLFFLWLALQERPSLHIRVWISDWGGGFESRWEVLCIFSLLLWDRTSAERHPLKFMDLWRRLWS